jgi:hypothetical protein
MALKAESRPILYGDSLQGAVKQRTVRCFDVVGQAVLIHGEAVVLARYHDLPCLKVLDRMIGTVVAKLHFQGARAAGQRE